MKHFLLAVTFSWITLVAFGQRQVETQLTPSHQAIAGTKVSLIPPKGFSTAQNFQGLQQSETQSSIMVVTVPGPVAEILAGMTPENLARQGVNATSIDPVQINGLSGIFIRGTQTAQGISFGKRIFIFGNETESLILNAAFPENLKETGDEIEQSLLGMYFETDKVLDPMAALDYSLDVSATKLKFGRAMGNSLIFTVDGKVPTSSPDQTSLIVAQSFSETNPADKKQFAINRLMQTPLQIQSTEYVREVSINGLEGYEIYAIGKDAKTGDAEYVYQVMLFTDGTYYILFGKTNDPGSESLAEIKKAIQTFKKK
jgi:hypothetical protein